MVSNKLLAILGVSLLLITLTSAISWSGGTTTGVGGNPFDQVLNTTSNVTFNNITLTGDLTADNIFANLFSGLFSWVIGSGESSAYLTFNESTLTFNETFLNATIDDRSGGGGGGGTVNPFDQVLNTTSNVTLNQLNVTSNFSADLTTLVVDSGNDRVGIGTDSPSHTLTVEGGINVTDNSNTIAMYFENSYLVIEG